MLTRLLISNFALIDSMEIVPSDSLSIITGETGAGKSIMLDALGLLFGEKIDPAAVTDKERKTVVEAEFTMIPYNVAARVHSLEPDWDGDTLILRREISPNNRSRAFINDSPVKISDLAEITGGLIDIHTQHSNMVLSAQSNQLKVIDALAGNERIIEEYRNEFNTYLQLRNSIKAFRDENERNRNDRQIIEFQLERLRKLDPKIGELEAVERRFDILSDAEEIRENLSSAYSSINGNEGTAIQLVSKAIEGISRVDMDLFESEEPLPHQDEISLDAFTVAERLQQVYVELKDIAETIEDYISQVEADPTELSRVSARMNELYAARKHFKVADGDELVALKQSLEKKMAMLDSGGKDLSEMEHKAKASAIRLKQKADLLTESRKKAALEFEKQLVATARPMGLSNLSFKVDFRRGKFSKDGNDNVVFLASFNKNMPLLEIAKVASGGELSRLMLSIKSIMAGKMNLPTVIFDEIDTGVSGEIADRMGFMMKHMARSVQVIAVTHLPQVASKGDVHFKVFKKDNETRTVSGVRLLDTEERVAEIAAMFSGEHLTEAAIQTARGLLK